MSETPRDQRALWHEVSRTFEEFGEALRVHLSPDAARTPSDPTSPGPSGGGSGTSTSASERDGSEWAPWADPARAGESEGYEDPWGAATDTPPRATTPGTGTTGPGTGPGTGPATGPATGPTTTGPATTGPGTAGPGAATGTTAAGGATGAPTDPGTIGAGTTGNDGAGNDGAGNAGAGTGAGGGGEREWGETSGGGRFASPADWESARESVRDLSSSVRRIATQAGDAARDPQVRDSAQRAARSLGDAIVTTVEEFAAELRDRMRNPRWSDTSRPPEYPPVAPIEDNPDKH